jgi:hypothetical protein
MAAIPSSEIDPVETKDAPATSKPVTPDPDFTDWRLELL